MTRKQEIEVLLRNLFGKLKFLSDVSNHTFSNDLLTNSKKIVEIGKQIEQYYKEYLSL